MTREEYERRKLQIEAERRAAVELIEASAQAQLRALELVWRMGGGGEVTELPGFSRPAAAVAEAPLPAPAPPAPAAAAPRPRLPIGKLINDVEAAVASLPDTFDTGDVIRLLGYSPHRGSLHRALGDLQGEGRIQIVELGSGRLLNRYRKLPPPQAGAAGGERGADSP